jgi:hypothetical protein
MSFLFDVNGILKNGIVGGLPGVVKRRFLGTKKLIPLK